jgi:hypothetical protein
VRGDVPVARTRATLPACEGSTGPAGRRWRCCASMARELPSFKESRWRARTARTSTSSSHETTKRPALAADLERLRLRSEPVSSNGEQVRRASLADGSVPLRATRDNEKDVAGTDIGKPTVDAATEAREARAGPRDVEAECPSPSDVEPRGPYPACEVALRVVAMRKLKLHACTALADERQHEPTRGVQGLGDEVPPVVGRQYEEAARCDDAGELPKTRLGIEQMLDHLGAQDEIELGVGEWEPLHVGTDELGMDASSSRSGPSGLQDALRDVDTDDSPGQRAESRECREIPSIPATGVEQGPRGRKPTKLFGDDLELAIQCRIEGDRLGVFEASASLVHVSQAIGRGLRRALLRRVHSVIRSGHLARGVATSRSSARLLEASSGAGEGAGAARPISPPPTPYAFSSVCGILCP